MVSKNLYTILIKKSGKYFIGLCPELNIAAQGEDLADVKGSMKDAIESALRVHREKRIRSAPLNIETLEEFLTENVDYSIRVDRHNHFAESFITTVSPGR